MNATADNLILALPKGRILKETMGLLAKAGIRSDSLFDDAGARQLCFDTNIDTVKIIRVRSFDVATFVAFGAAHIGICGHDVLTEFDYPEIYSPLDLNIGHCRLCVAASRSHAHRDDIAAWSHLRVATKYPETTKKYFEKRGIQADCIKLHGALELAPSLGLCVHIVDLVSTGKTLAAHDLVEVEQIMPVSSRLIVNRTAWKTRPQDMGFWITKFSTVCQDHATTS